MNCPDCNNEVERNYKFCKVCGADLVSGPTPPPLASSDPIDDNQPREQSIYSRPLQGGVLIIALIYAGLKLYVMIGGTVDNAERSHRNHQRTAPLTAVEPKPTAAPRRSIANPNPSPQWFRGGTLHQATIGDWRQATAENRLATCADFAAELSNTKEFTGLGIPARLLANCIDQVAKKPSMKKQEVSAVAASCWATIDHPTVP